MNDVPSRLLRLADLVAAVARGDSYVDPAIAIVVASAIVVLIAALAVTVALSLTPRKRKVVRRRQGSKPRTDPPSTVHEADSVADRQDVRPVSAATAPRSRTLLDGVLGPVALSGIAVALLFTTLGLSSTNGFCTSSCHVRERVAGLEHPPGPLTATPAEVKRVDTSYHGRCVSCHTSNLAGDLFDRARMLVVQTAGGSEEGVSAVVESEACLACHQSVLSGSLVVRSSGIRVSHREPHEKGVACVECHQRVGHGEASGPSMSQCVECHDGKSASARCSTCHTRNPTDAAVAADGTRRTRTPYLAVRLDSGNCYGCHEPAACDERCHGVRLPHPAAYVRGGHAYDAAFEKKERTCYRCHDSRDCSECHRAFPGHFAGWSRQHARPGWNATCSCHDHRAGGLKPGRFCLVCHSPDRGKRATLPRQ